MLMETKSHSQVIVDMDKVKEDDAPEPRKEKLFRDESKQVKDHVKWLVFSRFLLAIFAHSPNF